MDLRKGRGEDDRLSSLPDPLLLHILSFLETKHATATCILSSRWRKLWNFISNLDFRRYYPRTATKCRYDESNFIRLVQKSLCNHAALKIYKFRLSFLYREKQSSNVDVWLRFAVTKGVEELDIDLVSVVYGVDGRVRYSHSDYYKLPRWLFKCETLVSLKLRRCILDVPNFGCFSSLVVLSLKFLNLTAKMLQDLLEKCPLLEDLVIMGCPFSETSFCISSSSNSRLKHLEVSATMINGIEVDAPNLQILKFSVEAEGQFSLQDMPSLIEAYVDIDSVAAYSSTGRCSVSSLELTVQKLRHAKVLQLPSHCIQAMHTPTFNDLNSYIFKTKHLMLKTGLHNVELPGLANLLWSSPDLEMLVINLIEHRFVPVCGSIGEDNLSRKAGFDTRDYWESLTVLFPCLVHRLKSVNITHFIRFEKGKCGDLSNEMNLVRFLLKNAMVLEKITIDVSRDPCFKKIEAWQKILSNVTDKLTAIPRASPCVDVIFLHQ